MKKITAILFLFIYLFYTTGFGELVKVNVLFEHFYETKKNDRAVSFYYFLVMHYITNDLNDKDNERDKQLPFKSTETFVSNSTILYTPNLNIQPLSFRKFTINRAVKIIANDALVVKEFNSIVWHPPKYS